MSAIADNREGFALIAKTVLYLRLEKHRIGFSTVDDRNSFDTFHPFGSDRPRSTAASRTKGDGIYHPS